MASSFYTHLKRGVSTFVSRFGFFELAWQKQEDAKAATELAAPIVTEKVITMLVDTDRSEVKNALKIFGSMMSHSVSRFFLSLFFASLVTGCSSTGWNKFWNTPIADFSPKPNTCERTDSGFRYVDYQIEIISDPPGAIIEWNNEYVGPAPTTYTVTGDLGLYTSIPLTATPAQAGGYKQAKILSGNSPLPRKIYFNTNLGPANPTYDVNMNLKGSADLNVNVKQSQ